MVTTSARRGAPRRRVVLVVPSDGYRARPFSDAAAAIDVDVVVATDHAPPLATEMEDRLVVVDLMQHDRDDFRRQLGQLRNGFAATDLSSLLTQQLCSSVTVKPLAPAPKAKGPALLLATGIASERNHS